MPHDAAPGQDLLFAYSIVYDNLENVIKIPPNPMILDNGLVLLIRVGKVSKGAKIRNRYNQVPHLTQDTNWKVTNSQ